MLARQDALILAERLLAWKDRDIRRDLKAYRDVDPADAEEARDLLLKWLKRDPTPPASGRNPR
jgi:hypothetical protein